MQAINYKYQSSNIMINKMGNIDTHMLFASVLWLNKLSQTQRTTQHLELPILTIKNLYVTIVTT